MAELRKTSAETMPLPLPPPPPHKKTPNHRRIVWPVFGANAAAWLLTCIVLIKGVSSGGKVVYVTVTLPYLCIAALIARGATLPGGPEGIKEYLNVDVEKLQDVTTWVRAANQVFYSVGVAMGAIVTFGSYQQRKNASYARDGFIIPVINGLTSFLGGFAIFPMLGHIAQNTGLGIEDLDLSGFGVTFIAYTEGESREEEEKKGLRFPSPPSRRHVLTPSPLPLPLLLLRGRPCLPAQGLGPGLLRHLLPNDHHARGGYPDRSRGDRHHLRPGDESDGVLAGAPRHRGGVPRVLGHLPALRDGRGVLLGHVAVGLRKLHVHVHRGGCRPSRIL